MILEGCDACEHGWRYVGPGYPEALFPMPPGATAEQITRTNEARRIYDRAVFPCPTCRPLAFARWANGCFRSGHRSSKCDLCREALGEKAATRQDRAEARTGAEIRQAPAQAASPGPGF